MSPDFIVIGAQRAGTTWLHNCLIEHPDVFLPKEKELHFFDINYEKGMQWYLEKLGGEHNKKITGEITPNYYHNPEALKRIKKHLPEIKLIYIIREPKSRALSHYDLFKQDNYKDETLEYVVNNNPRIRHNSMQGKHLKCVINLFGQQKLLVLLYDDLQKNPTEFLNKIYKFLEINESFIPISTHKRINKVVFPRIQKLLRRLKLSWFIELVKSGPGAEWIKKIARQPNKEVHFSTEILEQFNNDICDLESLLNIDLSKWKNTITT